MIYTTIDNQWQLRDWFIKYDRDYFTPSQYEAIFNHYSELEDDFELDVIGICCDLTTSTWEELFDTFDGIQDQDELIYKLNDLTYVLHYDNDGVLYYNY